MANPAYALSCMKPDVAQAYGMASQSAKTYVVLKGVFSFEDALPPAVRENPQSLNLEAQFAGQLLTARGFTEDVAAPVEITLTCAGPWCATLNPASTHLAFVEVEGRQLRMTVGPCYQSLFADPANDTLKRIEQCAASGPCEPEAQ